MSVQIRLFLMAGVLLVAVFGYLVKSLWAARDLAEERAVTLEALREQLSSTVEILEARREELRALQIQADKVRAMLGEVYDRDDAAAEWGRICLPISVLDVLRDKAGAGAD